MAPAVGVQIGGTVQVLVWRGGLEISEGGGLTYIDSLAQCAEEEQPG